MYQNYYSKYLSKKNLAGLIILLFTCFCMIGCSEEKKLSDTKESVSIEDKNITAIRTVVENEFTGPNDEYVRLQKDIDMKMEELMSKPPGSVIGASPDGTLEWKAYEEFVEKTYKPYFTDNAFEKLLPTNFAFNYQHLLTTKDDASSYELRVSDIVIKQEKEHPTIYRFTFEVQFVNSAGETSTHQLKGEAICPLEGKIGRIQFSGDAIGLMDEIKSAG